MTCERTAPNPKEATLGKFLAAAKVGVVLPVWLKEVGNWAYQEESRNYSQPKGKRSGEPKPARLKTIQIRIKSKP
ncbi:hypothetical protein M413DRAFT_443884 [Hebeloma cylindrosporum]|uniref:Uncharacterized protein n=1 Tax=Hebeloma cylindrosporum TaxID=76867 RepID=A0A0C3C2A3_HEBCY|nr:hypothetical protein M413DRAFT_443884 [Hebeloma cylindrosporum h7]